MHVERHGERALVGATVDLSSYGHRVPKRDEGQWNETALGVAGTPLVDHPVVVCLHTQQSQFLVVTLEERLAAEARQHVGEADRDVDVVLVHGDQAVGLLPARRVDLIEGDGHNVQIVEAGSSRELWERVDEVVVNPPVAHLAAFDALFVGEDAAFEVEDGGVALDPWATIAVFGGQAGRPEVGRFDYVVVDRDDARNGRHRDS